jgi:hypothetical protein
MSQFGKYAEMRSNGASPHDVYLAAKADGIDAIKMILLLRQVFGLSLADVKRVTGVAEAWSAKQKVIPGAPVYWEGWSTDEGFYLMQARVKNIVDGSATLEGHRKFQVTNEGLVEVPVEGPQSACMRVDHLERPLSLRAEDLLRFVDDLSHLGSDEESERKAV